MKFYRFEITTKKENNKSRSTDVKQIITKVFSDKEVQNNEVFYYIDTLNHQKKANHIKDYSYTELSSNNLMRDIIPYMTVEDFNRMILLIPKEEKDNKKQDKKEWYPWC